MTNDDKSQVSDADLRQAWRQASDERPPAGLDQAVASFARQPRHRYADWTRPLAVAATLVLGIMLVHDVQSPLEPGTAGNADALPQTAEPEIAEEEASAPPGSAIEEIVVTGNRVPRAAAKTVAPAADAAEDRQQERARRETAMTADRFAPARDERAVMTTANKLSAVPATPACDEEQRETAASWWRCIEKLAETGKSDEADAELERLQAEYPGFTVPE